MAHMRKVFEFIMLLVPVISGLSTPGFSEGDISSAKKSEIMQNIRGLNIPFIANDGQMDERVKFYANTFGGAVFVTNDGEIVYSLPKSRNEGIGIRDQDSEKCRGELHSPDVMHDGGCGIHDNHKSCIKSCRLGEAERTQQNKNKAVIDGFTSPVRQAQDRFNPSCTTDITEAGHAPVEGKECIKQISDLHFPTPKSQSPTPNILSQGVVLRESLVGASISKITGEQPAVTKVNYFKGSDLSQWKINIATYDTVNLGEVYKGIELKLRAYGDNVEKLFYVKPGADPGQIKISLSGLKPHESQGKFERLFDGFTSFNPSYINPAIGNQACRLGEAKRTQQNSAAKGTSGLWVNEQGQLVAETGLGPVKFTKPAAYQEIDGKRVEVDVEYCIQNHIPKRTNAESQTPDSQSLMYSFKVAAYDKFHDLIIDPLLASTFLGGSSYDRVQALVLDNSGNVYVAGYTSSTDFPATTEAYDTSVNDSTDIFISKLDSTLSNLQNSTFLGGTGYDYVVAITLDSYGDVYVTGGTGSEDFPVSSGAYDTSHNSPIKTLFNTDDVFISKLDSTLSSLLASTYLGGSGGDIVQALVLDNSGNAYVTGYTDSTDFPTTNGAYNTSINGKWRAGDVFISKLDSTLSLLQASTYLGGGGADYGSSLALDSSGNVYVTGHTSSTYPGSTIYPETIFPTTSGAYDTSIDNSWYGYDVFIAKLDSTLSSLQASTFLGGSDSDESIGIALDTNGNVYVTGGTRSTDFPVTSDAYDTGHKYIFVSKLDSTLSSLLASTFLGNGNVNTLVLDNSGNVYVAGKTYSNDFPVTSGAYDTSFSYSFSMAFISKLDNLLTSLQASTYLGGGKNESSSSVNDITLDVDGNVYVAGDTTAFDFPVTTGAYDTSYDRSSNNYHNVKSFISKLDGNLSALLPSATTDKAYNITGEKATLLGTANANGSDIMVWFEYGESSGLYDYTTSAQKVTGSIDTSVYAPITGLTPSTTYYYCIVADNGGVKVEGGEKTFTTALTGAISGTVISKDTGEGMEDVKVRTWPADFNSEYGWFTIYTDKNGFFEFTDINMGTYYLIATKKGYKKAKKKVTLKSEKGKYVELILSKKSKSRPIIVPEEMVISH